MPPPDDERELTDVTPNHDQPPTPSHVRRYFSAKAATYDRVDEQVYWRLSDELLWHAIVTHVLPLLPNTFSFLDVGGGTGRWSLKLLNAISSSSGVLIDLTPEMVAEARRKLDAHAVSNRLELLVGNAELLDTHLPGAQFDLALCFHNVLGFCESPDLLLQQIASALRPGGVLAVFVPNQFHGIYFNLQLGRIDPAAQLASRPLGRFTQDMPAIHMFTPASLTTLLEGAHLRTSLVSGFPAFLYPSAAETRAVGSTKAIAELLETEHHYRQVYAIEEPFVGSPETAARGNNLFAIGIK